MGFVRHNCLFIRLSDYVADRGCGTDVDDVIDFLEENVLVIDDLYVVWVLCNVSVYSSFNMELRALFERSYATKM